MLFALIAGACNSPKPETAQTKSATVERLQPEMDRIIGQSTEIEVLGEGFDWAEGPVWIASHNMLLFTDVPKNIAYMWKEGEGVKPYLSPSGYTGDPEKASQEPGANGLAIDSNGNLLLCQHGDRQLARMNAPLDNAVAEFVPLASGFQGKRFNSPNDLAIKSNGDIYFTDPPYGLKGLDESPDKELAFNGIYRLRAGGEVDLLTDEMSKPNGIAFSPDEQILYVANSDPDRPVWMAFPVLEDGTLGEGKVFFDASGLDGPGLPDGLKVDREGNLFATGPGGVLIISPQGQHLGTIKTGAATANIAFGESETVAFITADDKLLRIRLRD